MNILYFIVWILFEVFLLFKFFVCLEVDVKIVILFVDIFFCFFFIWDVRCIFLLVLYVRCWIKDYYYLIDCFFIFYIMKSCFFFSMNDFYIVSYLVWKLGEWCVLSVFFVNCIYGVIVLRGIYNYWFNDNSLFFYLV